MMNLPQRPPNPFPGLRSFEAEEDYLFFGRETQTDELLRRLRSHRFLAVVGTSGSGKSSLVKAGLLPALYGGYMVQAGSSWRVAVLRPGRDPIANLAQALSDPEVLGVEGEDRALQQLITETVLHRGSLGLVEVVEQSPLGQDENLLVVVDQFEELFRFKQLSAEGQDEAAAFVKLLLAAVQQTELPIYVLLTMRSDFLGDCAQFRDLPETLNDSQYLIPRMTRDQLKQAIVGPVAVGKGQITPVLVNQLLNELGDNPDQLPVLQHALMRTWDAWNHREREIDLPDYETIGTMEAALSQHADQIYDQLSDPIRQRIAEKVFKCLTEKGPDGRGIRRPAPFGEMLTVIRQALEEDLTAAQVNDVIDYFRAPDCCFLLPPLHTPLEENTVLDISHESLMRVWQRLQTWLNQEAEAARAYTRLVETARLHAEDNADLLSDRELDYFTKWLVQAQPGPVWAKRYCPQVDFDQVMAFFEASKQKRYQATTATATERQTAEIERQATGDPGQIYLCYSRRDKAFVQRLYDALKANNRTVWVDWENIPPNAEWWQEVQSGIETSDSFVFILSPDSLAARVCQQELEHAVKHNKRLIPVLYRQEINVQQVHPAIAKHNWLFFRETDDFEQALKMLLTAIDVDLQHVRIHTRLLMRAIEWDRKNRDTSLLLRGSDLEEAEMWASTAAKQEPKPSQLQLEYVTTSRSVETARQQRERKRRRQVVMAATAGLIVSTLLGLIAFNQSRMANDQAQRARELAKQIERQKALLQQQQEQLKKLQQQQRPPGARMGGASR